MQCSEDLPYSQAKVDALLKRPTFYGASFLLQGFINSTVGW
jgi:hypothetical protein